jgi:aminoglycoside 6'-N-acetyltransferase I
MIRPFIMEDIPACARIMMSVYNNETWQCRWSSSTAEAYLTDFLRARKFVGFVLVEDSKTIGAIFCHEKIWWNNNELFVDEMFILPEMQRKGYGTQLLQAAENYITENRLAGFTLSTNRFSPAPDFYKKNGFSNADHVLFMYKVCE